MNSTLAKAMDKNTSMVDETVEKLLQSTPELPESLRKAMRYSLFAGGKRLRPTLVLAAAECCGLAPRKALKNGGRS